MLQISIRQALGILVGGLIFSAIFSMGLLAVSKFRSEAFFSTADMSMADLKQALPYLADVEKLRQFSASSEAYVDADLPALIKIFESPARLHEVIDPVYPYSRADLRDIVNISPAEGSSDVRPTTLLGLRVTYDSRDARTAWSTSRLAGDFAADGLLRFDVLRTLGECLAASSKDARESMSKLGRLGTERRGIDVRIKQLRELAGRQKNIKVDTRQVISLDKDTIQYLPLEAQITGIESKLAELSEEESRLLQVIKSAEFRRTLCERLGASSRELLSGAGALKSALAQTSPYRSPDEALEPIERQALQEINYALRAVETRRLERSGYSLEAQVPSRKNIPPLALVIGTSFVAGVLLGMAVLLVRRRLSTRSHD